MVVILIDAGFGGYVLEVSARWRELVAEKKAAKADSDTR